MVKTISLKTVINRFKGKKILVIGDVILDQHIQGSVSRISPEAPVPVVLQQKDPTYAPGGAANVAHNLRRLGARVTLAGRVGTDSDGRRLLALLKKMGVRTDGIFADRTIPTILKTRILAQHQQVLRVDRELVRDVDKSPVFKKILAYLEQHLRQFDGVIVSDYGKGMISQALIRHVCRLAHQHGRVITVDPKVEHFAYYRGVSAITPNKKEAENAIRNIKITQSDRADLGLNSDRLESVADVIRAGKQLLRYMDLESLLITLGEQGMCLFEQDNPPLHIHTRAREVYDVTGAGDTVIAVFTLGLVCGAARHQAADLANFAAGLVVAQMGAATVTREQLLEASQ